MRSVCFSFFFFNDPATTEIYTLSLHDALPILATSRHAIDVHALERGLRGPPSHLRVEAVEGTTRSEEHTSELQSLTNLVCRLLLEKKKKKKRKQTKYKRIKSKR